MPRRDSARMAAAAAAATLILVLSLCAPHVAAQGAMLMMTMIAMIVMMTWTAPSVCHRRAPVLTRARPWCSDVRTNH
jgi:hypothetical protein